VIVPHFFVGLILVGSFNKSKAVSFPLVGGVVGVAGHQFVFTVFPAPIKVK
jgi:hypothetical protein